MGELSAVIHLAAGRRLLRFSPATRVQHVLRRVTTRLESDEHQPFAILVPESVPPEAAVPQVDEAMMRRRGSMLALCVVGGDGAVSWLSEQRLMVDVLPDSEHRLELRIRVLDCSYQELLQNDPVAFQFLYEQRRGEFLSVQQSAVSLDSALKLACYDLRRYFSDLPQKALDKKSNIEYLEQKVGIDKFLPVCWVDATKPKVLRKLIQQQFKKVGHLNNIDSMLAYLQLLDIEVPWKAEFMLCRSLQRSRLLLTVTAARGVVLEEDSGSRREWLRVPLEDLSDVTVTAHEDGFLLTLNVTSGPPVSVMFDSPDQCHTAASLIDAHYRLKMDSSDGVWQPPSSEVPPGQHVPIPAAPGDSDLYADYAEIFEMRRTPLPALPVRSVCAEGGSEDDNGYSSVEEVCMEVQRDCVHLDQVLGEGQYGHVFLGTYSPTSGDGSTSAAPIAVAVKTCKENVEPTQLDSFLSEARNMLQLQHPHIVKLLGMCSERPVLILMEPAALGELRAYLRRHSDAISTSTLVLFISQLSQALAYLESKRFVHRDIAARNVLVYDPQCVKLADFGLGRWLDQESVYRAAKCKLPIKWMAPESINFRRFSCESDVWMFGVCVWEVMSLCVEKPFQGVDNSEVANLIENGGRLQRPTACPPPVYGLMLNCWHYDPARRPRFHEISVQLQQMYETGGYNTVEVEDLPETAPGSESRSESPSGFEPVSMAPTASRDRNGDSVFRHTTAVVSAVVEMSRAVQSHSGDDYGALVRGIASPLRQLLASVDVALSRLPAASHARVQMAHKVLAKDMQDLVEAMRRALHYDNTTLDEEYRKQMLNAAHVVAVDSKSLLDIVDTVRDDAANT